jgi:phosphatidylglycerol:prolipoprotein diacylglycerol transferase
MHSSPILFTAGKSIFVTYGLWMAMGMVTASTACVFYVAKTLSWSEIPNEVLYLPLSIIAWSIFGARLFSMIFEDGFQKLWKSPLKAFLRPGFWLHGGLTFLLLAVYANRHVISHPFVFFDGAGLGFPLYEAFSRIGCHSYGCCFGKCVTEKSRWWTSYHHPSFAVNRLRPDLQGKRLFPVQLISAALFFAQFCILLMAPSMKPGMLFGASLLFHSVIRLVTENFRDDPRGTPTFFRFGPVCFYLSVTGIFATIQMAVSMIAMVASVFGTSISGTSSIGIEFSIYDFVKSNSILFVFVSLVYGYHYGKVGQWVPQ